MFKHDKSGMHKIYDKWDEIAKTSYESVRDVVDLKNIDHVVFCGMGGSGTVGDIFSSILSKSNIHTYVVKGYHLPNTIDKNSLVIAVSVSGNTRETLSVLEASAKLDCKIAAFSSGGKMQEFCNKNNMFHKKLEYNHSPRASLTSFLYPMLAVLGPQLGIKKEDIQESINQLESLKNNIGSSNIGYDNPALELANWISGIPMIYYPWGLTAAAIRFKNCLQENCKNHAMAEDVLEACHNGIVAWEKPSSVQPILIKGQDDYYMTKQVWKVVEDYFNSANIEFKTVTSVKGSILTKLINLIYFLDYTTIYRSLLDGTDPTPIDSIALIKNNLSKK